LLERSRDEHHPERDDGNRRQRRPLRTFAEQGPREQTDEDDLRVPENRREACAHLLDRVVPQDEIGGEETARDRGENRRPPSRPTVATVLEPREQPERRQRPHAAVEGARGRRDVCQAEENPGESDRDRTDEDGQDRSLAGAAEHSVTLPEEG
jgi:hypothetical protein